MKNLFLLLILSILFSCEKHPIHQVNDVRFIINQSDVKAVIYDGVFDTLEIKGTYDKSYRIPDFIDPKIYIIDKKNNDTVFTFVYLNGKLLHSEKIY